MLLPYIQVVDDDSMAMKVLADSGAKIQFHSQPKNSVSTSDLSKLMERCFKATAGNNLDTESYQAKWLGLARAPFPAPGIERTWLELLTA